MKIKLKDNISFEVFSVLNLSEDRYDRRAYESFKRHGAVVEKWSQHSYHPYKVVGKTNVHYYTEQEFELLFEEDVVDQELKMYASYIVEATREKLGYSYDDTSHDEEVLEHLQSGEKLSKSKHMS